MNNKKNEYTVTKISKYNDEISSSNKQLRSDIISVGIGVLASIVSSVSAVNYVDIHVIPTAFFGLTSLISAGGAIYFFNETLKSTAKIARLSNNINELIELKCDMENIENEEEIGKGRKR